MEQRHEGLSWKWNECFFFNSKTNFYFWLFPVLTFDSNVRWKINTWNQGGKLSFQSVKPQIKQNSSSFAKTEEALNAFKRYCLNVCVNSCLYHKDFIRFLLLAFFSKHLSSTYALQRHRFTSTSNLLFRVAPIHPDHVSDAWTIKKEKVDKETDKLGR